VKGRGKEKRKETEKERKKKVIHLFANLFGFDLNRGVEGRVARGVVEFGEFGLEVLADLVLLRHHCRGERRGLPLRTTTFNFRNKIYNKGKVKEDEEDGKSRKN